MKKIMMCILPLMSGLSIIGVIWIFGKVNYRDSSHLRDLYYQNLLQKRQLISIDTIVQSSHFTNRTPIEIIKNFPFSLWHSENRDYSLRNDRIDSQRKWMEYLSELQEPVPVKNILVFIKGKDTYDVKSEKKEFCQSTNKISVKCNFVRANIEDMDLYASNISKFDAVVSAVNSIEKHEISLWKQASLSAHSPPPHVYFTLESPISPFVRPVNLSVNNKIVASYWSNADISLPYGKWVRKVNNEVTSSKQKNFAEGKTKLVAMLVSNCRDRNGRLNYAAALNEYIQVDIYGDCSPDGLGCDNDNCYEILKKEYKFYLAFENANCREYITEKLFRNALQNDIVPIVMGAHPDDYKAVAPNHSYIHVEDFKSPEKLADYLMKLNNSDELYNEYFKWKGTGQFIDTRSDFFCRVCAMMIYSDFHPKPMWPTNSTLQTENHCLTDDVWYWTH